MLTLGLNGRPFGFHDPAVALVDERGEVLFHAEEERFSRVRHGLRQSPIRALHAALKQTGSEVTDIGAVSIGWDPARFLGSERTNPGHHRARVAEMMGMLRLPDSVRRVEFVPHHLAHASHAFFGSGFESAAVVVIDGSGERESSSIFLAEGHQIVRVDDQPIGRSLGYLFQACALWLGLGEFGEGKAMGLASYGNPADSWDLGEHGAAIGSTIDHTAVISHWLDAFCELTGRPCAAAPPDALHEDALAVQLARSVQDHLANEVMGYVARARQLTGRDDVCLAGGVALNSAANGLIPDPLFVPNCPGDGGVALGAAFRLHPPETRSTVSPFTGATAPLEAWQQTGVTLEPFDAAAAARLLATGAVGALFVGRSECGPRALGHRSLVCRPDRSELARSLNRRKGREPWRPFGPVAIRGKELWAPRDHLGRYMAGVVAVGAKGRHQLNGVRHIDGTVRPQVIDDLSEPLAHLLAALEQQTGLQALINTSFNLAGEPIVETPAQALHTARAVQAAFLVTDHGWTRLGADNHG